MNSNANIAARLSIRPKVNSQLKLAGFIEFFTSIWWVTVDMPISVLWKGTFDLD